MNFPTWKE